MVEFSVALLPGCGGCSSNQRLTGSGRVGNDLSHNDVVEGRVVQILTDGSHVLDVLVPKGIATRCAIEKRTAASIQEMLGNLVHFRKLHS